MAILGNTTITELNVLGNLKKNGTNVSLEGHTHNYLSSSSTLDATKLTGSIPTSCYTNTTYSAATTAANGLMTSAMVTKLNGIASGANAYSHPGGDGNLHVPATGTNNNGKFLMAGATAGSLSWGTPTNTTYSAATTAANGLMTSAMVTKLNGIASGATSNTTMVGATASANGTAGLVPAPASGKQASYLRGDGSWAVPTNTTYSAATTAANGLMTSAMVTKLNGIATGATAVTSYAGANSAGGPANEVVASAGSDDAARYVYFAYNSTDYNGASSTKAKLVYDADFKYNPNKNVLTVGNINIGTGSGETSVVFKDKSNTTYSSSIYCKNDELAVWNVRTNSQGNFLTGNLRTTTAKIADKVTLQWNAATESLDFVFA